MSSRIRTSSRSSRSSLVARVHSSDQFAGISDTDQALLYAFSACRVSADGGRRAYLNGDLLRARLGVDAGLLRLGLDLADQPVRSERRRTSSAPAPTVALTFSTPSWSCAESARSGYDDRTFSTPLASFCPAATSASFAVCATVFKRRGVVESARTAGRALGGVSAASRRGCRALTAKPVSRR